MRNSIVVIAARALLASIENESIEKEDEELTDLQQLCFYHGKGGSGKSHLIRAFTALADSCWSRSSGVQFLVAPASQL
jgi:chromosomal replication initiation ATPase DnaA